MSYYEKIEATASFLNGKISKKISNAVILGTGLGDFVDSVEISKEIPYEEIPNFPVSTVKSHSGKLIVGTIKNKDVIVLAGRFHYYEGYDMQTLTLPVRVLKMIGVENLFITNVSGGVNENYNAGDLIIIRDHINFLPENPLRGFNDERLGPRFPDMTHTYSKFFRDRAKVIAQKKGIEVREGVYFGWQGPNLETPAEYEMIHRMGGDMVGMSTVPEVIVAKHAGLNIFGASIVSNVCYPLDRIVETSVEDVIAVAKKGGSKLSVLLSELIP